MLLQVMIPSKRPRHPRPGGRRCARRGGLTALAAAGAAALAAAPGTARAVTVGATPPLSAAAAPAAAQAAAERPAAPTVPARAATLTTDARCYAQGEPLRLAADGLTPGAPLTVALDGRPLRYRDGSLPHADESGVHASSFLVPALAPGVNQARHVLTVDDGLSRARASFTVSRPAGATFAPRNGDPRTLRVRFRAWGFALGSGRNQRLWLHWIDPEGAVRRTASLGVTRGDCGHLVSARRRAFPFPVTSGRWQLVIDTSRRYRLQADGPRAKISVRIRPLAP